MSFIFNRSIVYRATTINPSCLVGRPRNTNPNREPGGRGSMVGINVGSENWLKNMKTLNGGEIPNRFYLSTVSHKSSQKTRNAPFPPSINNRTDQLRQDESNYEGILSSRGRRRVSYCSTRPFEKCRLNKSKRGYLIGAQAERYAVFPSAT